LNRRDFIISAASGTLAYLSSSFSDAFALGEISKIKIPLVKYSGNFSSRKNAPFVLAQELAFRTSIDVKLDGGIIPLSSGDIFRNPFLLMTGDRSFAKLSRPESDNLAKFLDTGGFLFIDNAGMPSMSKGFESSVYSMVEALFPNNKLKVIPSTHVIYRCFYKIIEPAGRTATAPYLEGLFLHNRPVLVYSKNDLCGALSRDVLGAWEYEVVPGGEKQRENAVRMGINIVMYSLCLDYKDDQVHIDYLIKKRNWKIKDFK
jgi:hypothetical protein